MVFPFGQHPPKECNPFPVNCNVDLATFGSGSDFSSVLKPENDSAIVEHCHLFDHFHPNSGIKLVKFSGLGYDRPQIGLDFFGSYFPFHAFLLQDCDLSSNLLIAIH